MIKQVLSKTYIVGAIQIKSRTIGKRQRNGRSVMVSGSQVPEIEMERISALS